MPTAPDISEAYWRPFPLRPGLQKVVGKDIEPRELPQATLSIYRPLSLGVVLVWLFQLGNMLLQYHRHAGSEAFGVFLGFWLLLLAMGCAVGVSVFVNRIRFYRITYLAFSLAYVAVILIHCGYLHHGGQSPLSALMLGDAVYVPAVMLATVCSNWRGVCLAIAMTLGAVLTNYNLLGAAPFDMVLGAINSLLVLAPFIVILNFGVRTTQAFDELAKRSVERTVQGNQTSLVEQYRNRFQGYLHDQVFPYLQALGKGVQPESNLQTIRQRSIALAENTGLMPLTEAVRTCAAMIAEAYPQAIIVLPENIPPDVTVSSHVAATITEAALETVSNCAKHAPNASCRVSFDCPDDGGMSIKVADEGPGLDPALVGHDRAGLRIAIVGRMTALPGGSAQVDSRLGEGTTVTLGWHPVAPFPSSLGLNPNAYSMMGMSRLLWPGNFALVLAFLTAISYASWPNTNWSYFAVSYIAMLAVLVALFSGRTYDLSTTGTVVATVGLALFFVAGLLSQGEKSDHWPFMWSLWAFTLLVGFMILRGRVLVGWLIWLGGVGVFTIMRDSGILMEGTLAFQMLPMTPFLLSATVVPAVTRRATAKIPSLWASYTNQQMASGLAIVRNTLAAQSTQWLSDQLVALNNSHNIARDAALLERRLRDSIRSPLFDVPEVTRGTWLARSRGATVRLLDDRRAKDGVEDDYAALLDTVEDKLEKVESTGFLTVRVNPPGRKHFASLVFSVNAEAVPERVYF